MLRSNISLILALTSTLALTACSIPSPQSPSNSGKGEENSATFYADRSEVTVTSEILNPKISLPVAKSYSFRVCVRDQKLQKAISNHDFHIKGGGEALEGKKLTSDTNGCFFWSEKISYNHLADAKFVEVRRSIVAHGLHKGVRSIPFALNPWEDQGYSLLEKDIKGVVPADQAQATLMGTDGNKSVRKTAVWFDDLRLTIDEKRIDKKGIVLNFEIRALPNFSWMKNSGQRVLEPLTYGEFEGELSLIHVVSENQKEVRRFLQAPITIKGSMSNNYLLLETPMTLDRICTRGQVQLGLKLKALNAPENLGGFEGVFIVGECDQIKGNSFSRLKNMFQEGKGALTIQDYLTDLTPGPAPINPGEPGGTSQKDSYQLGQVVIKKLRFDNVSFSNKSSFHRSKTFNVIACMRVGLDEKALRAQVFKVKKINGQTEDIRSNDDSCISWDDSLDFNYLDQECWSQKEIQISNSNLGLSQTLKINVNPWTQGESAFRDIRLLNPAGQALSCADGKSEIVLTGYSFDKKEFAYDINHSLQIKVKKTGILRLAPILKRPSLTEPSGFEQLPLPVGPYLLKFAVVDNLVKDFSQSSRQIFKTDEKLVFVNAGGVISELVTLETWNIKAMGNTNQLILELVPAKADAAALLKANPNLAMESLIDPQNTVKPQAYSAPLIMANNNEGASATLLDETANLPKGSLVTALKKQFALDLIADNQETQALSGKDFLAKNENLEMINVKNEATALPLHKSLLEGTPSQSLADELCRYWFFERLRKTVRQIQVPRLPKTGKPGLFEISPLPAYSTASSQLNNQCQADVSKDLSTWFDVQNRYFLSNTSMVQTLSPQTRDFSMQTSFSMSRGHSDSISKSRTWDIGFSGSFAPKLGFFGASVGGGFRASRAETSSDADSFGNSASYSSGISATVERLAFKLASTNVEKCTVIKLNPKLYADPKKSEMVQMMDDRLTEIEKFKLLNEGLIICQGEAKIAKMEFIETYFVLNQKLVTQVTDQNSDASRPFHATIRGIRDFNAFMSYLQGTIGHPTSVNGNFQVQQVHDDKITNAFLKGVRAYPGQYLSPQ